MNKIYECIEEFYVEKYDDDDFPTGDYFTIEKGTIWELDNSLSLGISDYHLKFCGEQDCRWLEVSAETLNEYFKLCER